MSWDEALFGWLWRRARERARTARASGHPVVLLASLQERLQVVALAVGGPGTKVLAAEADGGVGQRLIRLPTSLDVFPREERTVSLYVARTALAATAIRHRLVPSTSLEGVARAVLTLLVVDEARRALAEELPAAELLLTSLGEELLTLRAAERTPERRNERRKERAVRGAGADEALERAMSLTLAGREPWPRRVGVSLSELALEISRELRGATLPPASPLWGWVLPPTEDLAETNEPTRGPPPTGTERSFRARDHVLRKSIGESKLNESPLIHSFEKLHTLEEHSGGMKRIDGSDEIEAHADALDELDLRELIRSNEEARSLLRSDVMFESGAGDVRDAAIPDGIPYDEWHEGERAFRRGWCRVAVEAAPNARDPRAAERQLRTLARGCTASIEAVRAELRRVALARRARPRQRDGADVDHDALVSRHAALCAGSSPPDRLYVAARRHAPSLAVLLLVDLSLSTDGWIDGERVLDVERQATFVLGEALEGIVPELGVAGFASHTRRHCKFVVLKGMQEPWIAARHRLVALEPGGYTRIGPAVRHATTVLQRTAARRRLLLVLTDGKPNDFDRYEGRHGIADVRHAVLEASALGVHTHALAIDRSARAALGQMFDHQRYTLLGAPSELAGAMGHIVATMVR